MPRRMEPLTVGLLNKGGFGAEMDREFKDLQKQHVGYLQRYGDKAKGSKAKMVVTIELECQEPDTEFFSITTQIKKAIPSHHRSTAQVLVTLTRPMNCACSSGPPAQITTPRNSRPSTMS